MRILLTTLNSKYIHSNLALRYLYESAGIYRDFLEVREFTINNDDMSIYIDIMRGGYDVICFSCYIWNVTKITALINDIKRADPGVKIIVGGPEVTYDPEDFLRKSPSTDLLMLGEGDSSFPRLVKDLAEGTWEWPEDRILRSDIPSAEDISFPYQNLDMDPDRIVYYESARGCPFKCAFCLSSESRGVRLFPVDRVLKEIDFFLEKRVKQVKFVDRTFNIDMKRSAQIMDHIIDNDNGVTNFHFELCGDLISDEMLDAFARARTGLFQVEVGVQSTCTEALRACGRSVDHEKLKKNVLKIEAGRNVHMHLDLIAGLPYESFERFAQSFNDVYEMGPDDLQLGFLKLIRGTRLRREAEKYGYVFRDTEPYEVISNDFITGWELIRLKMVETVLELYYNKPGFRNSLRYIMEDLKLKPFDFYMELADYYYDNGWNEAYHSRDTLYNILEDFVIPKVSDPEGLKELLLYDKMSTAAPSRYSDRAYADSVHSYLRELGGAERSARDMIKRVNYGVFNYNTCEFAGGEAGLERNEAETLLVFFSDEKNAGGEALCRKIY